VTPTEFRERTSLTFHSRSASTHKLDDAYGAYHGARNTENADKLYAALRSYLMEHGGYWNRAARNTASGGLLEWMYNELAPVGVRITPERARALDAAAAKRINDTEIPHSRFGVLYLLGNIKIEGDWVASAIEGVSVVGGAVGAGVGTDYARLHQADSARTAFSVGGQAARSNTVITGGQTVLLIPRTALGVSGTVGRQALPEAPSPDLFPCSGRLLSSAAAAISDTYDHNKFLGILAGAGVTAVTIPAALGTAVADVGIMLYRLGSWLWEKISGAIKSVIDLLKRKWNDGTTWMSEKVGTAVKLATKFVIDMVFKQAAPLVGSLIDLGGGIVRSVDAACTRIASYLDRRQIRLQPGHPEETANAIEHAMTMGLFKGLADVLKGAGKTAVAVMLPGLGSLVSALMSALEWMVKFLYRYFESERIDAFLEKAQKRWKAEEVKMYAAALRGVRKLEPDENPHMQPVLDEGSFLRNTEEFTTFFREGCEASPVIPMLTLNSGICGSLMTLIKLFDDDTGALSRNPGGRQPFDIGGAFFTRLKHYSQEYLLGAGYKFSPLLEANDQIRGLLNHALNKHQRPIAGAGSKALAFIRST
jgi:hypothetical protein